MRHHPDKLKDLLPARDEAWAQHVVHAEGLGRMDARVLQFSVPRAARGSGRGPWTGSCRPGGFCRRQAGRRSAGAATLAGRPQSRCPSRPPSCGFPRRSLSSFSLGSHPSGGRRAGGGAAGDVLTLCVDQRGAGKQLLAQEAERRSHRRFFFKCEALFEALVEDCVPRLRRRGNAQRLNDGVQLVLALMSLSFTQVLICMCRPRMKSVSRAP